jgi:hypothetical protein
MARKRLMKSDFDRLPLPRPSIESKILPAMTDWFEADGAAAVDVMVDVMAWSGGK